MNSYGVIILAAGTSSRLGQPKQLLPFGKYNLLEHTILQTRNLRATERVVVLGANEQQISSTIGQEEITIVINQDYQEGMASSIAAGLSSLLERNPRLDAVIFLVCDQPLLSSIHLEKLVEEYEGKLKGIVASGYLNTKGVPVLFDKKYFQELLRLKGQEGAKKLISRFPDDVFVVSFPDGAIDIDTMDDYRAAISKL